MASQLMSSSGLAAAPFRARSVQQRSVRGQLVIRAATAVPTQYKTVNPVGDRVFIKVDKGEETTLGGLILPSSAQKKPTQGTVVAAPKAKDVAVGDVVVYSKYAGTELSVSDDSFVLLKTEDCIGKMTNDDVSSMQPLGDRILIEVEGAEEQTVGGVLLTESAKEKPTLGKVVAVGSGKEEDGKMVVPNVAVGSTVLYSKYSGTEFKGANDKEYIVVRESDILAALA